MAPLWVVGALELEASPTTLPIVEQRRAQRRRVHAISLAVQVSVPTSTTCKKPKPKPKPKHKHMVGIKKENQVDLGKQNA